MRDGVAHTHFFRSFDAADDVAHIAGTQLFAGFHVQTKHSYLVGIVFLAGGEKFHMVAGSYPTVHDAEVADNAAERIEYRVEYQRLQRSIRVTLGRGDTVHNGIQNLWHSHTRLGRTTQDLLRLASQ